MFLWYFLLAGLGADAFIPDLDCLNIQLFINIFFLVREQMNVPKKMLC